MVALPLLAASNMLFMSCMPMLRREKVLPLDARKGTKVSPFTLARMETSAAGVSKKVTRTSPMAGAPGSRPT